MNCLVCGRAVYVYSFSTIGDDNPLDPDKTRIILCLPCRTRYNELSGDMHTLEPGLPSTRHALETLLKMICECPPLPPQKLKDMVFMSWGDDWYVLEETPRQRLASRND